jgi:coniferyl-aldehyde dehydrogenase
MHSNPSPEPPPADPAIEAAFASAHHASRSAPIPGLATRRARLRALREALRRHETTLVAAADADFGGRSADETRLLELLPVASAIRYCERRVGRWIQPRRRHIAWYFLPARVQVHYQPLGLVGIIAPWNYPFNLSLTPLAFALAAGNRALLKLSEFTPRTAAAVAALLADAFPDGAAAVVTGGPDAGRAFSRLPFDHLMFTGSGAVGRQVMRAAADHLCPVTLELGGKSPALIDDDARPAAVAASLAFGKGLNSGQTCVAPDYLLVPRPMLPAITAALQTAFTARWPRIAGNPDWTALIHPAQQQRIAALLDEIRGRCPIIPLHPGEPGPNHGDRRHGPCLVIDPPPGCRLLTEEIFGPLLPVIPYDSFDEALAIINGRDRPLALYYFGHRRDRQRRVLAETRSGGICFNECLLQAALDDAPFGGVGPAGMGNYHGEEGFRTFSHARTLLAKGRFSSTPLVHPPYAARPWTRLLTRWFGA